jgi:hypothetical protein
MAEMAKHGGGGVGAGAMGMGMGAGFGMMYPTMMRDAMQATMPGNQVPGNQPQVAPAAAAGAAAAGGGPDFADLKPLVVDPKQLVRGVAQSAGWQLTDTGEQWQVVVPVGPLRKQRVTVRFDVKDPEGNPMLVFSSVCGPANDKNAMSLLKYNAQMVHGAFAIESGPAGDVVAVRANEIAKMADPLSVTRVITAIAWQADKVEEKLLGSDNH